MIQLKKPHEIEKILEGGRILGEILQKLAAMVVPGVSGFDIDHAAEELILAAGGKPAFKGYKSYKKDPAFPCTICFSVNEEVVHGIATKEKVLKQGDIVTIDIGMQYPARNGYFTDTAITVPVGNISQEASQLIENTKKSLFRGIDAAVVGNSIADIGRAIESYIAPYGYGIVRDLVGHGVGYGVHEDPRVPNYYDSDLDDVMIKPGLVIAIEPMITMGDYRVKTAKDKWSILTVDNSIAAHVEHTIIVTDSGPIIATERPEERENS